MGVEVISPCSGPVHPGLFRLVRKASSILLAACSRGGHELNVLLVNDSFIADMNRKWFGRNRPTNVISFPQEGCGHEDRIPENPVLGDIVISVDTAGREARGAGMTVNRRILELLVHGFAHLMGFDHENGPEESLKMASEEKRLMDIIGKEKLMADLCVNVDHIATIRQARGTDEPDPVIAAGIVELAGADGIVVHLREDRRHIQDRDLRILRETVRTRLTLEMAATDEMLKIARQTGPDIVTLVPEKRQELTTEGGLDVKTLEADIRRAVDMLHEASIPVSLFVDPEMDQVEAARRTGADCVELHTGRYADAGSADREDMEFENLARCARAGWEMGLRIHAGHGLTYRNVARLAGLSEIAEFSIGHSIISMAALVGLDRAVRDMAALIKQGFVC